MLSCVRCKEDKSVKRGALVKSLAICSPVPWIHVFKVGPMNYNRRYANGKVKVPLIANLQPILLLALEEYFNNPSPEILEHLYDCCNSTQILAMPRLSRAEKILMRQSDRKDLFKDRYEIASATARELETEAAFLADSGGLDALRPRPGSGSGLGSADMLRKGSSSSSLTAPAPTAGGRLTPERKGMRDTHFFEADVRFRRINVPMKIPISTFDEEIGDVSWVRR